MKTPESYKIDACAAHVRDLVTELGSIGESLQNLEGNVPAAIAGSTCFTLARQFSAAADQLVDASESIEDISA